MNLIAQALYPKSGYAWIITKDHLAECEGHESTDGPIGNVVYCDGSCNRGEAGITGPSTATEEDLARLKAGKGDTFKMYDDDGELYYTGRLVVSGETTHDDEEACIGPLDDFGMPNAGCTEIRWPGHPERNCS